MRIWLIRYVTYEDMTKNETWLFKWKICIRKIKNSVKQKNWISIYNYYIPIDKYKLMNLYLTCMLQNS